MNNDTNLGFAAAQNQGIRSTRGEYYLALNPDVDMSPGFVEEQVKAMEVDSRVGSVKLSEKARKRVSAHYSWERVTDAYEALLQFLPDWRRMKTALGKCKA